MLTFLWWLMFDNMKRLGFWAAYLSTNKNARVGNQTLANH